jgi:hypothetical protein
MSLKIYTASLEYETLFLGYVVWNGQMRSPYKRLLKASKEKIILNVLVVVR